MHELSICNALLDQVERIAAERGAHSVAKIVLRIGPLSGVEPELLRNAYPLFAAAISRDILRGKKNNRCQNNPAITIGTKYGRFCSYKQT